MLSCELIELLLLILSSNFYRIYLGLGRVLKKRGIKMKTEKEKMLSGEMYNPADPQLVKDREEARKKVRIYNQTLERPKT